MAISFENQRRDAGTLMGVAESMTSHIRTQNLGNQAFGRSALMQVGKDGIKNLVKAVAETAFLNEKVSIGESAGLMTNESKNAKFRGELVDKIKKEYVARAENLLLQSQHSGGVLSNITTYQQLYMVALIQGVIQPSYSKIFKTVVDPNPIFTRSISYPRIIDHLGNAAPLIDVINDKKRILELTQGAGANITFGLEVQGQKIEKNILDAYRNNMASQNVPANFGPRNFINRGFKITSMKYEDGGQVKVIPINFTSMENHSQSGEISDTVGTINLSLSPTATGVTTKIDIFGRVLANGDVKIAVSDPNVKELEFKFNLPPVGVQNPYTVQHINSKFQESITQNAKASCTLNEMFLDDHVFYVNKDAIETFNTDVVMITNGQKDAFAFDTVDKLEAELAEGTTHAFINDSNYFEGPTRKKLFSDVLDMNVVATTARLNDASTTANNLMLAQRLFKVLNNIDLFMNPKERNFTIYSASAGVQWLKDAYGNNVSKFNMIGSVGNEIAGITTPYDILRTTVGEIYNVNYVATNREVVEVEEADHTKYGTNGFIPNNQKANLETTTFHVIPTFEEEKDTLLMVSGKEYLTEGTGTAEDPASPSLNYQHRFDMLKMNKVLGKLRFTEIPTAFHK